MRREVVRIISPGTLTEDNLLERKTNNFLGAISDNNRSFSVAWVDVSTGCFKSRNIVEDNKSNRKQLLANFLLRMNFSELLISEDFNMDGKPDLLVVDEYQLLADQKGLSLKAVLLVLFQA